MAKSYPLCKYTQHFLCPFISWWVPSLTTCAGNVNSVATNMGEWVSHLYAEIVPFWYKPRSGITRKHGTAIITLVFRNLHAVLYNGNFWAFLFLHILSSRYYLFIYFLWIVILTGVGWYLAVDFTFTSFMVNDIKHFSHVIVDHSHSFFYKHLFRFFPIFKLDCCCFLATDLDSVIYPWHQPFVWRRVGTYLLMFSHCLFSLPTEVF